MSHTVRDTQEHWLASNACTLRWMHADAWSTHKMGTWTARDMFALEPTGVERIQPLSKCWCAFVCSSCICLHLPRCTRSCDSILWVTYTAWFTLVAFLIHTGCTPSFLLSRHLISASQNITTKMMLWGSSSADATKSCLDVSEESCSLACSCFVSFAEDCMCKQLCCSCKASDSYLQEVSLSFASCH